MKKIHIALLSIGLFMFASIFKVFAMTAAPEMGPLLPRQIDLSGTIFSFKMPEDFSNTMPADNLIDTLNISAPDLFKGADASVLMRRWWDIKQTGFWGKEFGSLMMSVSVRKKPLNKANILKAKEYDLRNMLHFIIATYDSLKQRYQAHNEEVVSVGNDGLVVYIPPPATKYGNELTTSYKSTEINQKKWLFTSTAQESQLGQFYVIPLSQDVVLEVEFAIMPNDRANAREFSEIATNRIKHIAETFQLDYHQGNEFQDLVENTWREKTTLSVLQNNKEQFSIGVKQ